MQSRTVVFVDEGNRARVARFDPEMNAMGDPELVNMPAAPWIHVASGFFVLGTMTKALSICIPGAIAGSPPTFQRVEIPGVGLGPPRPVLDGTCVIVVSPHGDNVSRVLVWLSRLEDGTVRVAQTELKLQFKKELEIVGIDFTKHVAIVCETGENIKDPVPLYAVDVHTGNVTNSGTIAPQTATSHLLRPVLHRIAPQ
jgi:hypothetical protein